MRGKLHQFMTLRAVYIIKLEMDFFLVGGGGCGGGGRFSCACEVSEVD